jgi:integrase
MFAKWQWRDGRVREDPLVHLSLPKVVHKRERQALRPEDAARLIATTRTGPRTYELTGEDRASLDALALGTGFRANELRNLTREDFAMEADPPTVTCRVREEPRGSRPADRARSRRRPPPVAGNEAVG